MADERTSGDRQEDPEAPKPVLKLAIGLGAALAAIALAWRWLAPAAPDAPPADGADPVASGAASASASAAVPARCTEATPGKAFVIGDPPAPKPPPAAPAASSPIPEPEEPDEDELAPFAVEVGRAAAFDGGFAVGTLRAGEGGAVATIAIVGKDGEGGRLVKLARSRGDMDPPVVAARGAEVLAAMMEPNAGGRAIRVARVTGETVTWGPELSEGRDESMGLDVAASGTRALVAWDDLPTGQDHTRVMIASFDPATMRAEGASRPASPPKIDAESPRLTPRAGGFWLTWIARGQATAEPARDAADAAPPKKRRPRDDDEVDETKGGEGVAAAWIEVVPLDERGAPTGAAIEATPRNGHVLAYDVSAGDGDSLLVAWRDDDTPSGSSGGVVSLVKITPGGVGQPHVVADEGIGTGVPTLLPGWIAIAPISGAKRLARLSPDGAPLDAPAPEAALGTAEPLAATDDAVLVAKPTGRAMRLSVVRCR